MSDKEQAGGLASVLSASLLVLLTIGGRACIKNVDNLARIGGDDVVTRVSREALEQAPHSMGDDAARASRAVAHVGEVSDGSGNKIISELVQPADVPWEPLAGEKIFYKPLSISDKWLIDLYTIPAEKPRLLAVVPTDDSSYKSIFGSLPSAATQQKIDDVIRLIEQSPYDIVIERSGADQMMHNIEGSEGKLVVLLGHSDGSQGQKLILADGSAMDISSIHSQCLQLQKVCLVLTCNGDDFSIQGKISTVEAFEMWRFAVETTARPQEEATILDFITAAREYRSKLRVRERIVLSSVVAGGAGGATYYVVTSRQESRTRVGMPRRR